ncbi:UDP-2,3-diacylglucosamine diphosphatase [Crenothrix sp.]|uniref:UDP-2,3-diacylglucosamine diphosphatase n=1 Tax=Crenothrix sp. TaxID=3100433 RepID=UPI00374CF66F
MQNQTLFISDLHLSLEKPHITRRFLDFLKNRAIHAEALYILGDLFDTWVGDDDFMPPTKQIRKQLKQLTDSGVKVYLQQGNRDFLLGQRFCQATGVILLDDYTVIDLYGVATLLMHGDLLCTDDLPYQAFRIKSHTTEWQQNVLSKPLVLRLLVARWYRLRSYFHKRGKTQDIMDVNQNTVIETLRTYNCVRLIHGHTHRPHVHSFEMDGKTAQRFVLSEWHNHKTEILCWTNNGYCIEVGVANLSTEMNALH